MQIQECKVKFILVDAIYFYKTPRIKYINDKTITSWFWENTEIQGFGLLKVAVISSQNTHTTVFISMIAFCIYFKKTFTKKRG